MLSTDNPKGRKPGQCAKGHRQAQGPPAHLQLSRLGTFDPQAVRLLEWLQFLARFRTALEGQSKGRQLRARLREAGLPPRNGATVRNKARPLFAVSKAAALGILNALLGAVETGDAAFFHELARRTESTPDLYRPADPLRHALAAYLAQGGSKAGVKASTLRDFAAAKHPEAKFDDRTLRRAAKEFGFTFPPPGRPRKTGT
jgi:hypothetical protein